MEHFKKHQKYYLVSILIFIMGLVLLVVSTGNHVLQSIFIVMIAVMYFVWSLIHHYVHHRLHPKIVIEYALITTLGIVLSLYLFSV